MESVLNGLLAFCGIGIAVGIIWLFVGHFIGRDRMD